MVGRVNHDWGLYSVGSCAEESPHRPSKASSRRTTTAHAANDIGASTKKTHSTTKRKSRKLPSKSSDILKKAPTMRSAARTKKRKRVPSHNGKLLQAKNGHRHAPKRQKHCESFEAFLALQPKEENYRSPSNMNSDDMDLVNAFLDDDVTGRHESEGSDLFGFVPKSASNGSNDRMGIVGDNQVSSDHPSSHSPLTRGNNPSTIKTKHFSSSHMSSLLKTSHAPHFIEEALANQYAALEYATRVDQLDCCWEDFTQAKFKTKSMQKRIESGKQTNSSNIDTFLSTPMANYYSATKDELNRKTGTFEYFGEDRPYLPHDIVTNQDKLDTFEREMQGTESGVIHMPFDLHEYYLIFQCPADMNNEELVSFLPGRTLQDLEYFIKDADEYSYESLVDTTIIYKEQPKCPYGGIRDILINRNLYGNGFAGGPDDFAHNSLCFHWTQMSTSSDRSQHAIHKSYFAPFSGAIVEVLPLNHDLVAACSTNVGERTSGVTCALLDISTGKSTPIDYGNTVYDIKLVGDFLTHFVAACEDGRLRVYKSEMIEHMTASVQGVDHDNTMDERLRLRPIVVGDSHNGSAIFVDWNSTFGIIASCSNKDDGIFLWNFDEDDIEENWEVAAICDVPSKRKKRGEGYSIDELFFGVNFSEKSVFGYKEGHTIGLCEWQLKQDGSSAYYQLPLTLDTNYATTSTEGDRVIVGNSLGAMSVIDLKSHKRIFQNEDLFSDAIVHMSCSGNYLAAGCKDFSVMVYDARNMAYPLQNYRHRPLLDQQWQGVNRVVWNHSSGRILYSGR